LTESQTLTEDEANELVMEHAGWAQSIARAVARAWSLDWQMDGLDGAAMEALIFCSRRYQPDMGVPFRGYARRRIHEASTEAARQSKGWAKAGSASQNERIAKEVAVELFELFPDLRSGILPQVDEQQGEQSLRASIRQLLIGATLVTTRQGMDDAGPDEIIDLKKSISFIGSLDPIHQLIIWKMYWESESMRGIATEWETDELNIIREHKVLLEYLQKCFTTARALPPPRVRPGLKTLALQFRKKKTKGPFTEFLKRGDHA